MKINSSHPVSFSLVLLDIISFFVVFILVSVYVEHRDKFYSSFVPCVGLKIPLPIPEKEKPIFIPRNGLLDPRVFKVSLKHPPAFI